MRRLVVILLGLSLSACLRQRGVLCGKQGVHGNDLLQQFIALEEQGLAATSREEYLFIFMPSFEHVSLARVSADGAVFKGAYAFGERCPQDTAPRTVSTEQWKKLTGLIDEGAFWTEQPQRTRSRRLCRDGNSWVLEGVRDGKRQRIWLHDCDFDLLWSEPHHAKLNSAMRLMMHLAEAPTLWFARD